MHVTDFKLSRQHSDRTSMMLQLSVDDSQNSRILATNRLTALNERSNHPHDSRKSILFSEFLLELLVTYHIDENVIEILRSKLREYERRTSLIY